MQWLMICTEGEVTTVEVVSEVRDCPNSGQAFALIARVVRFCPVVAATGICNNVLLSRIGLGQDSPYAGLSLVSL